MKSIELFAGAGGMALGLEQAGFDTVLFNEIDKDAATTLRYNRPDWNVIQEDVKNIDFRSYKNQIDVLSGGFPCQSFSYAGKQLGFKDTRGTLFFQFARAISECKPRVLLAENVKGLLTHDNGKTLETILSVIKELGYSIAGCRVLNAAYHNVPQKRERLFLIGVREDVLDFSFNWPIASEHPMPIWKALLGCPTSIGQKYPAWKEAIMKQVPPGGCWRDLPLETQQSYMGKSFYAGGGRTGMARRLAWLEPCLTLTCSPAQKQTERCHPEETRPLTVREYARIQTFPDSWEFKGSLTSQYRQIGNAVPVNLAFALANSIKNSFNVS